MDVEHEKVCRLCLDAVTNEFGEIDDVTRQMFNILSLKLDLDITRDPIICWDCVEVAKKCLKFKLTCFTTERVIHLFSTDRENGRHNIEAIYKEREDLEISLDKDFDICRICMTRTERNNIVLMDTLRNEMTIYKIISEYLPEMDFNIIENPMICTTCRENLESYFKFVLKCINMEVKIKSCCKRDILEDPEKYPHVGAIKEGSNACEDAKCVYPEVHDGFIKYEELDIKEEETDLAENFYKCVPKEGFDRYTLSPKGFDKEMKSNTILVKTRGENTRKYTYQKMVQTNATKRSLNHGDVFKVDKKECSGVRINKGAVRTDETNENENVKRELKTNIGASERDMYKHTSCASKEERRSVLRNQIGQVASNRKKEKYKVYKCSMCAYEGKNKSYLTNHMLVHKDISQIKTYKCLLCAYEAKRKKSLNTHMLVHKDISEIEMHKCSLCPYEAKRKGQLKIHMLIHKDISEIKMHKCSLCPYEAKRKGQLKIHMLIHKDVSEIKMYKCSLCDYEAKRKSEIKTHMLVHKKVPKIKTHKCLLCAYETKEKTSFKTHMLVHIDMSKINIYKCPLCDYEAKQQVSLKTHMLVHKDVSKINIYKCPLCDYEAKQQVSLKTHMSLHKDVSKINIYKCPLCAYEANQQVSLKTHMLVHKEVSKITVYKCPLCGYETNQQVGLKTHMLVHKDVFKTNMHKCSLCAYETTQKYDLGTHTLLVHKVSQKKTHKFKFYTYKA